MTLRFASDKVYKFPSSPAVHSIHTDSVQPLSTVVLLTVILLVETAMFSDLNESLSTHPTFLTWQEEIGHPLLLSFKKKSLIVDFNSRAEPKLIWISVEVVELSWRTLVQSGFYVKVNFYNFTTFPLNVHFKQTYSEYP